MNLPSSYGERVKNVREQLSVAVWYLFENVFGMQLTLFQNSSILKNLDEILSEKLKEQRVYGVEYRQRNNKDVDTMIHNLTKNGILYAFQTPGIKLRNSKFNRMATLIYEDINKYKKGEKDENWYKNMQAELESNKKKHYSGVDLFGYEDDPFNGARNFFPLALQKVLKNDEMLSEGRTHSRKIDWFLPVYRVMKNEKVFLHAGETNFFPDYPVDDKFLDYFYINDTLFHAALLPNVERIGHGFAVARNDLLQAIFAERDILIGICPMSNDALRYYHTFEHPFPKLLRKGLKVSINPDDPGFFGYEGVSHDWFKIFMETDLKPKEIYFFAKYSIEKASDIMFEKLIPEK